MNKAISILALLALIIADNSLAAQPAEDNIDINDATFGCIRDMTPVRGFYVDNLLGSLEGTLAVANSPGGGVYPPGSVVQLVPGEVMVKQPRGASPATRDWEFFELDVSAQGATIRKRGFADVVNRFGGNCLACHVKAQPQWDMICESGHGCDPIPLSRDMLDVLQKTDPRCEDNPSLTPEEVEILKRLQANLQPQA